MGTGRWLEETSRAYKLPEDFFASSQKIKYRILPGVTACILMLVLTGALASNVAGRWMVKQWDKLFTHIPIVKSIYNSDGREASPWVREPVKHLKGVDAPQMSSGLKVKGPGVLKEGSICSLAIKGTNLCDAGAGSWWQSGDF